MLEQRAKEHRELKMKRRQEKLEERRQRQIQREKEQEEERKKREEKKRLHNLSMPIIGLCSERSPWLNTFRALGDKQHQQRFFYFRNWWHYKTLCVIIVTKAEVRGHSNPVKMSAWLQIYFILFCVWLKLAR